MDGWKGGGKGSDGVGAGICLVHVIIASAAASSSLLPPPLYICKYTTTVAVLMTFDHSLWYW